MSTLATLLALEKERLKKFFPQKPFPHSPIIVHKTQPPNIGGIGGGIQGENCKPTIPNIGGIGGGFSRDKGENKLCQNCTDWQQLSMCRGYCHRKWIETSMIARCGKVAGFAC